jgi:hypothetical protein
MQVKDFWEDPVNAADEALLFAEELGAIPKFPSWSRPATAAVAEVIAEICTGPQQASALVKAAIRTMPEWGGIPGLRAIHAEQNDTHMERSWKAPAYWDGGSPLCDLCADTGAVQSAPGEMFRECSCAEGRTITTGQHIQALNREIEWARTKRMHAKQAKKHHRPVNHEEIARNITVLEGKAE